MSTPNPTSITNAVNPPAAPPAVPEPEKLVTPPAEPAPSAEPVPPVEPAPSEPPADRDVSWLPEQYHQDEMFNEMNNFEDLANALKDARDIKDLSKFEGWEHLREKHPDLMETLGVPADKDGYKIDIEGVDPDIASAVIDFAHEKNIPAHFLQGLAEVVVQTELKQMEAEKAQEQEALVQGEEKLRELWGNKHDDNVKLVNDAIDEFSPDGYMREVFRDNPSLLVDPRVANFLRDVGVAIGDPSAPTGVDGAGGRRVISTVAQAEARKNYIFNNEALREQYKQGGEVYEEVVRLNEIIAKKR